MEDCANAEEEKLRPWAAGLLSVGGAKTTSLLSTRSGRRLSRKSLVTKLLVWKKIGNNTKTHLWEMLYGRTPEMGGVSWSNNQGWWTSEVAQAVCEKKEAWKEIEKTNKRGNQRDARMMHTYGQKKKAAEICR